MSIEDQIQALEKRRSERRATAKKTAGLRRRAFADRAEIRRELKGKRRRRIDLGQELAEARTEDERRRVERDLAHNRRIRADLALALREANAEIDGLTDALRARRAGVARATGKIKRLRRRAEPDVISRSEWGASPPRGSYTAQSRFIAGVQHHTADPALSPSASIAEEAARMRQIQAGHLAQGWTDIGYAFVVFPSGRIYAGRPASAVGAHTLGHNTGYAGWSYDANTDETPVTDAGLASCRRVRREILDVGGVRLYGHRDLGPTACPGRDLYSKLDRL